MIKIYNSDYVFLKLLSSYRNLYTTETLSTGFKTLCFQVPCKDEYIELFQEENYVETIDYVYVIKEIIMEDNDFFTVYCQPNLEELKGRYFTAFDAFEKSIADVYTYCLSLSDWKLDYQSENFSIVTYQLPNANGYEMIEQLASDIGQDIWFDTKNKVLRVYDRMGAEFGAFYSNELKLKSLSKQSQSYDYFTVLYPIGKDGLKIGFINNNKDFLENYNYSNKHIEKYIYYDDIDQMDVLKFKAQQYLDDNCMPKASYKLSLSNIGNDVRLGDTIYLVDKIKRIKQQQRVVKLIRYEQAPERDTIEISNLQVDFARDFVKEQKRIAKEMAQLKKQLADLTTH